MASMGALAAPRAFPLTWTSRTLEAGGHDFQTWLTPRIARLDDSLVLTQGRMVMGTGIISGLEALWGLDLDFAGNSSRTTIDPLLTTLWRWAPLKANGVLGLGGFARGSLGFDSAELEARLFVDKQFGKLLLALNGSASRRFFWAGRTGVDTHLEESLGARYAVGPSASFGLELYLKSGFLRGEYQGTAIYVGPSFTFEFQKLWVSLGATAQVAADQAPGARVKGQPLELTDNERFVGRVVVGYAAE
jgi:hypothetical protein